MSQTQTYACRAAGYILADIAPPPNFLSWHSSTNSLSTMSPLRAAILIVSETASRDASTDKGIPALQEVFAQNGGDQWTANDTRIVTDNVLDIQRVITEWTDGPEPVNLILTSGGTGFAQKDVTPEVSRVNSKLPTCDSALLQILHRSAARYSCGDRHCVTAVDR